MDRIIVNMDFDWRFHLGEVDVDLKNAHNVSYNSCKAGGQMGPGGKTYFDSEWRRVDLPHDYFAESDFSADNLHSHGYRTRSNAWYRKAFVLDESYEGKQILIDFEGTAVNAEFYFNGSLMARFETVRYRIEAFLSGEIDKIEELCENRIPFGYSNFGESDGEAIFYDDHFIHSFTPGVYR